MPKNDEERSQQEDDDKNYIRGRIAFLADDPGRQTMTGSFNPIDVGEWSEFAYLGSTEMLFAAIVKNDIAAVKALLAEAANAEKAKEGGNVQANVLVDVVDLNRRDHVGRTPLHMAIMCKAMEIAFELIDAGVRMTARLVDGRTALHLAAQQNLPSVVEKLLQKSAENAEKAKAEAEAVAAAQSLTKDDEGVNTDENEDSSEDDWESDDEGGKKAAVAEAAEIPPAGADIPDDNTELPDVFDINVFDWDFAFSPLAHAIVSGSKEVVQQLLGAGADAKLASRTSESMRTSCSL